MNNYYDDIELEYNNFLAEQELFDNLLSLSCSIYHESVGLFLIQEDYKDTVNNYIEKIVAGIQKAWNNFKEKVINVTVKPILDSVNANIDSYDGALEVQYWHKYNLNKFDSLRMVDFNFELLSSSENKTDYYNKAYSGIMTDKNLSLKENIINLIIDTEDTHTVTVDEMKEMYDFCTRGFKERVQKIETEIDALNKNINTMKTAINVSSVGGEVQTVSNQTEIQNNSADILSDLYESYNVVLNEAEDNNSKSTKISNNNQEKDNTNNQKNNVKKMTWYLSGNTDIFSAKLKILRQKYLDSIRIFKAVFPRENKKEEDTVEVKQTTRRTQQIKK